MKFTRLSELRKVVPSCVVWVCDALKIGSGRPSLIQGYSASGKTWIAQALAVAVATGNPLFGVYPVRQGKVLHLDYEMGPSDCVSRYDRLLAPLAASDPDLHIASLPIERLTDHDMGAVLVDATRGFALCIVDALLPSMVGVNENASSIREHLDKLTRASQETGCAFVVIHHAGKSSDSKVKDLRELGRGSSAIFDASGTVWNVGVVQEGVRQGQYEMVQAKIAASGGKRTDERIHVQLVEQEPGLKVVKA